MSTTAVILARGLGTRMRKESDVELTHDQAQAAARGHKALMPIGDHCLIDYSLSAMADAGVTQVVLVVPPDHEAFKEHFEEVAPKRLTVRYAVQEEALGTANALLSAKDAVGDASFVMANGDNLYPVGAIRALLNHEGNSLAGFHKDSLIAESNIPEDRISAFSLVRSTNGVFDSLVEKPTADQIEELGADALVSMNLFGFTPEIFDACAQVKKSARGEYEIVDAVSMLPEVAVLPVEGGVLDLSRRDDIDDVQRRLADFQVSL